MDGQSNFNCIGLYKRQPGDPPVPGYQRRQLERIHSRFRLIKHRTPLENAFLSVLQDEKRPHLAHVMVQGTADLIIDACSHLWNGQTLTEIDSSARRKVADFYQRHSMTG